MTNTRTHEHKHKTQTHTVPHLQRFTKISILHPIHVVELDVCFRLIVVDRQLAVLSIERLACPTKPRKHLHHHYAVRVLLQDSKILIDILDSLVWRVRGRVAAGGDASDGEDTLKKNDYMRRWEKITRRLEYKARARKQIGYDRLVGFKRSRFQLLG